LNIAKTMPAPIDGCGQVKYGFVTNQDEGLPVGRIDWQLNQKHSLFGRFSGGILNQDSTFDGKNPSSLNTFAISDLDYQLALGDTSLFGNNVVSAFRVSASRANVVKIPDSYGSLGNFGANYTAIGGKTMNMTGRTRIRHRIGVFRSGPIS
jgi:hypothetical protein